MFGPCARVQSGLRRLSIIKTLLRRILAIMIRTFSNSVDKSVRKDADRRKSK